jgi:hypothetical protein
VAIYVADPNYLLLGNRSEKLSAQYRLLEKLLKCFHQGALPRRHATEVEPAQRDVQKLRGTDTLVKQ